MFKIFLEKVKNLNTDFVSPGLPSHLLPLSHYSIHRDMLESHLCHEAFPFLGYTLGSLEVIDPNVGFCCPHHTLYPALLLSSYSTFIPSYSTTSSL